MLNVEQMTSLTNALILTVFLIALAWANSEKQEK